jgi:hypothetical protein
MIVFWRLVLAYLVSDFIVTTELFSKLKSRPILNFIVQFFVHFIVAFVLTCEFFDIAWADFGYMDISGPLAIVILSLGHYIHDRWSIFSLLSFNMSCCAGLAFLWNKFLFLVLIFVFSPIVGFQDSGTFFPEKITMLSALLMFISHTTTDFIYHMENDVYGVDYPPFDERYLMILQRCILWLGLLLSGFLWIPAVAVWAGIIVYLKKIRIIDFSKVGFYIGTIIVVIIALVARHIAGPVF